jgi:hypothetical protein
MGKVSYLARPVSQVPLPESVDRRWRTQKTPPCLNEAWKRIDKMGIQSSNLRIDCAPSCYCDTLHCFLCVGNRSTAIGRVRGHP